MSTPPLHYYRQRIEAITQVLPPILVYSQTPPILNPMETAKPSLLRLGRPLYHLVIPDRWALMDGINKVDITTIHTKLTSQDIIDRHYNPGSLRNREVLQIIVNLPVLPPPIPIHRRLRTTLYH